MVLASDEKVEKRNSGTGRKPLDASVMFRTLIFSDVDFVDCQKDRDVRWTKKHGKKPLTLNSVHNVCYCILNTIMINSTLERLVIPKLATHPACAPVGRPLQLRWSNGICSPRASADGSADERKVSAVWYDSLHSGL